MKTDKNMKRIIQTLMLFLLLSSCCREDSIEVARYELGAQELALLPYSNGQKVSFVHSNGYAFDFNVIEDRIEWEQHHAFCEWNCCGNEYYSYQMKTTILESTIQISLEFIGAAQIRVYPNPKYRIYYRILSVSV